MISKVRLFFSLIVLLALLAGLCLVSYKLATFVWHPFSTLDPALAAGIIAASATIVASIIGSIIAVLVAKHLEQKAFIRNEHRKQVTPIYEEFIHFVFEMLYSNKLGKKPKTKEEMTEQMAHFVQKIIVWGSDDVINNYYIFRKISNASKNEKDEVNQTSKSMIYAIENLFLAIRRDLGHSNKGLSRGKILGLIADDIDKYIDVK